MSDSTWSYYQFSNGSYYIDMPKLEWERVPRPLAIDLISLLERLACLRLKGHSHRSASLRAIVVVYT